MRRWARLAATGIAALLGAAMVTGFSPFDAWAVPPLALAAMLLLMERASTGRQRRWLGFAFGMGQFATGVSWIRISLHDYGGMPAALSWAAALLFCAYLALFPMLAFWRTAAARGDAVWRHAVLFPALWTLTEWLRGTLFTGFPWLNAGYSQLDSLLRGFAPLLGVYGVSLAVAVAAGLLAVLASRRRLAAAGGLCFLWVLGGYLAWYPWTRPDGAPVPVRLVQGDIPQEMKWQPDELLHTLALYQRLGSSPAQLVVLPETAFPLFEDELPDDYFAALARGLSNPGGNLLYGVVQRGRDTYYNAMASVGAAPRQVYRKWHLVPFGEYVPLRPAFGWILDALRIPLTDFSRGPEAPQPMRLGNLRVAADICFEDVFGEEIIRQLPAANLLVNATNDAWFGGSQAAVQHLGMARMRAMETGRYMARATNTGVTAVIDPRGAVVARLPSGVRGALDGEVQPYAGATPYVRWGNVPALLLALLMAAASAAAARRRRPPAA